MTEISIIELLKIAWRHIWAIILAAAIFGGMAFAYARYVIVPTYSTTTSIIFTNGGILDSDKSNSQISQKGEYVNGSDISASNSLGQTIVEILKTPNIYKELASELDNKYTYSQLSSAFSINRKSDDTLLIDISYTSTDGEEAVKIVNKFAELSCDYVSEFIPYSKVMVVAKALKYSEVSVGAVKLTVIFALVGAVLAYGIFFLIYLSDQSIRGEEDYNAHYTVPLLGVVPDFNTEKTGGKYGKGYKSGYYNSYRGGYYNAKGQY